MHNAASFLYISRSRSEKKTLQVTSTKSKFVSTLRDVLPIAKLRRTFDTSLTSLPCHLLIERTTKRRRCQHLRVLCEVSQTIPE